MSAEDDKAVVRRYFEEYHTRRRLELLDELVAEHLRAPTAAAQAGLERAFPDYAVAIQWQVADEVGVATVWSARGTHEGPWDSPAGLVEATGRNVEWTATTTLSVRDARITDVLGTHWDHLGLLQQMGVLEGLPGRSGFFRPRPGA